MSTNTKTKQLTYGIIRAEDMPEGLKAAGGDDIDLWAYASVEVADREGDIVRIDGISLEEHKAESPIKILCSHDRKLSLDGYPIVGKVVEFRRTTYRHPTAGTVPALAFGMKFAPSKFGQTIKELYDGQYLTDFSIGFAPTANPTPIQAGGFDYPWSRLMEISSCVMGMNQHAQAHIQRALGIEDAVAADAGPLIAEKRIQSLMDDIECMIYATTDKAVEAAVAKAFSATQATDDDPDGEDEPDSEEQRAETLKALNDALQATLAKLKK